jgi:hypothetical protein
MPESGIFRPAGDPPERGTFSPAPRFAGQNGDFAFMIQGLPVRDGARLGLGMTAPEGHLHRSASAVVRTFPKSTDESCPDK